MSTNLVGLVMKQVGGNLPGVLGSLLGESADRTKGALSAAVPVILAGLMGVASKGGDAAERLASAVSHQDDSMLDDLVGVLGGGEHQAMADRGSAMLSSLLGDGVIGGLVGTVGKFSGLGSGSTKSLLGLLAPIVMSVLSREKKAEGLDDAGLVNMLMGQKENVESAMPAGMASALGAAGLLDSLMGAPSSATASIDEAVDRATGTAGKVAGAAATAAGPAAERSSHVAPQASSAASSTAASRGAWLRWAVPLVILLALIWLAYTFLAGGDIEETASAASAAVEVTTISSRQAPPGVFFVPFRFLAQNSPCSSGHWVLCENTWLSSPGGDSLGPALISPI